MDLDEIFNKMQAIQLDDEAIKKGFEADDPFKKYALESLHNVFRLAQSMDDNKERWEVYINKFSPNQCASH